MDKHPARIIVVLPMHETVGYRTRLAAVDDSLVVHRRGDGGFLFALRAMRRLGPRTAAEWLVALAADLVAGHVAVIADRDDFLAEIETLALDGTTGKRRDDVERAVATITERTRHQIMDHLDGEDTEFVSGRALIARRPRRTKPEPNRRDGLNFIRGVPTPRAEQMWNALLSEWCDVREAQHGRAAWERWVRGRRPDMPIADR